MYQINIAWKQSPWESIQLFLLYTIMQNILEFLCKKLQSSSMDLNFWKELSQSVKPNEHHTHAQTHTQTHTHTHTEAIVVLYQKQDMTGWVPEKNGYVLHNMVSFWKKLLSYRYRITFTTMSLSLFFYSKHLLLLKSQESYFTNEKRMSTKIT